MKNKYCSAMERVKISSQAEKKILSNVLEQLKTDSDNNYNEKYAAKDVKPDFCPKLFSFFSRNKRQKSENQEKRFYSGRFRAAGAAAACCIVLLTVSVVYISHMYNISDDKTATARPTSECNVKAVGGNPIQNSKPAKNPKQNRVKNHKGNAQILVGSSANNLSGEEQIQKPRVSNSPQTKNRQSKISTSKKPGFSKKPASSQKPGTSSRPRVPASRRAYISDTVSDDMSVSQDVQTNSSPSSSSIGLLQTSPVTNTDGVDGIKRHVKFTLQIPTALPEGYQFKKTSVIFGKIAQIVYSNGSDSITFKTTGGLGGINNAGANNMLSDTVAVGNIKVSVEGNSGLVNFAAWTQDNCSFSLTFTNGIDKNTLIAIIKSIKAA